VDTKEVSAKRAAVEASGGCSHRKFSKEFSDKLNEISSLHDKIKEEVKGLLEGQGLRCNEEFPLEADYNGSKLKGRIDIACEGPADLIVEVKSSKVGDGRLADIYQALIYGDMWKRARGKRPQIVLVYRRGLEGVKGTEKEVELDLGPLNDRERLKVRLPSKYIYIKLNVDLDVKGLAKELGTQGYVLSRDCEFCVNEECPLRRARPTQL